MSWNYRGLHKVLAVAERPPIAMGGLGCVVPCRPGGVWRQDSSPSAVGGNRDARRKAVDGGEHPLPARPRHGWGNGRRQDRRGTFFHPRRERRLPGKYRVEIGASRKSGRKVPHPISQQPIDELEQFLPERYNLQSTLTAEVTAAGPNRFEFALESK